MDCIKIPNGRIRELEESDLGVLIEMSEEKYVKDYYFITPPDSIEDHWNSKYDNQIESRESEADYIRNEYCLPIEHEGIVKGLISFNVDAYVFFGEDDCPEKHDFELSYFVGKEYGDDHDI